MGKSTGRAAPKAPARDVYRSSGLVVGSNPPRGTTFLNLRITNGLCATHLSFCPFRADVKQLQSCQERIP